MFLNQGPIAMSSILIVIGVQIWLFRSRWGLRTRAVGEHPRAAETVGIDVIRLRYRNVLAGGLLFAPSSDSRFRAFDSKTGKQLWEVKMDGNMGANPMTYTGKNGKQYVAGVVGGAVVAFALP